MSAGLCNITFHILSMFTCARSFIMYAMLAGNILYMYRSHSLLSELMHETVISS